MKFFDKLKTSLGSKLIKPIYRFAVPKPYYGKQPSFQETMDKLSKLKPVEAITTKPKIIMNGTPTKA